MIKKRKNSKVKYIFIKCFLNYFYFFKKGEIEDYEDEVSIFKDIEINAC